MNEFSFLHNTTTNPINGFNKQTFTKHTFIRRYVDDSVAISTIYCTPCLHILLCNTVYPFTTFEPQLESTTIAHTNNNTITHTHWLDLTITLDRNRLYISMTPPTLAKTIVPPNLGNTPHDMKSRVRNLESRILSTYLQPKHGIKTLFQHMQLWIDNGYPYKTICNTFNKFLHTPELALAAKDFCLQ